MKGERIRERNKNSQWDKQEEDRSHSVTGDNSVTGHCLHSRHVP